MLIQARISHWMDEVLIGIIGQRTICGIGWLSRCACHQYTSRRLGNTYHHEADPRVRKFALPLALTSLHKTPINDLMMKNPELYLDLSLTRWTLLVYAQRCGIDHEIIIERDLFAKRERYTVGAPNAERSRRSPSTGRRVLESAPLKPVSPKL
jgi:hypothetical protein